MKTRKINLTITGCLGRMGQQLIKSANKDKRFKISSLTENKIQRKKIIGILPKLNSAEAFKKSDVIIDFTVPKCSFEVLRIASKLNSAPTGYCIQPLAIKIHSAEKFEPMATSQVAIRCFTFDILSQPKKNNPTKVDSKKKAIRPSMASGAPKISPT